ncbi:hypothetical protein NHJ13734_005793 [Beauveria thailandica]
MGGFTIFPHLPIEIRLRIWLFSVPDDEAEICLPWPGSVPNSLYAYTNPLYTLPCQPLTVDVVFPVAMHVCREGRSVVQDSQRSGVFFRASQAAGCPTPFRHFRPELDVLYLGDQGIFFMDMFVWPENSVFDSARPYDRGQQSQWRKFLETLKLTRRFAVATTNIPGNCRMIKEFFTRVWTFNDPPRPLRFEFCYVVPTTKNITEMDPDNVHAAFVPPGRRCRLVNIRESDWGGILVPTNNMRSNPPQTLKKLVTQTIGEIRAVQEGRGLGARRKVDGPEIMDIVDVTAGTFLEYQHDGSWTEVCATRMYSSEKMYIPEPLLAERPDPEVQRVHDADIELRLVPWDEGNDTDYSDDE